MRHGPVGGPRGTQGLEAGELKGPRRGELHRPTVEAGPFEVSLGVVGYLPPHGDGGRSEPLQEEIDTIPYEPLVPPEYLAVSVALFHLSSLSLVRHRKPDEQQPFWSVMRVRQENPEGTPVVPPRHRRLPCAAEVAGLNVGLARVAARPVEVHVAVVPRLLMKFDDPRLKPLDDRDPVASHQASLTALRGAVAPASKPHYGNSVTHSL